MGISFRCERVAGHFGAEGAQIVTLFHFGRSLRIENASDGPWGPSRAVWTGTASMENQRSSDERRRRNGGSAGA
jgi:hypothetical protein